MTDIPSKEACEWAANFLETHATLMEGSRPDGVAPELVGLFNGVMEHGHRSFTDVATYLRSLHEEATDD